MSQHDLLDLARSVVGRAEEDEELEAFVVREVTTQIEALDGAVDALSSAETRGVGVRIIRDGRQGYASTSDVAPDSLDRAVTEARSNAAVATPDDANRLPEAQAPPDLDGLMDEALATTPIEARIELALGLEAAARSSEPRVRGVDTATYADARRELAIASTAGLALEQQRTDAWAYLDVLVAEGDDVQSGLGLTLGRGPSALDVEAAGREAARRAGRLLGARKPASRRTAVVFDPLVTAQFLGVLGQALSAESVLKQRSLFAGRLGEEVAAADVALLDDGLRAGAPGTAPWDAEGVPQQRTELIAGGALRSYLQTTWTAAKTSADARSTGNASRGSVKTSPGVAPTNLYLQPGDDGPRAVLARVADGVYVQDVMGLHSGANPVSGEFSVSFSGLAIRDGELAEPIREAAVSSTITDVLTGIQAVADDLRFYPFGGSLGGSTVLIAEMSVSGS